MKNMLFKPLQATEINVYCQFFEQQSKLHSCNIKKTHTRTHYKHGFWAKSWVLKKCIINKIKIPPDFAGPQKFCLQFYIILILACQD